MTAYVVETTAAGTSAIAVLEVVGPEAQEAVARAFGPNRVRPDRPLHTMIADADGELDDVVIAYRPPEKSMTGWPHVEIQCHGSPSIVKRVRRALVAVGVKPAPRTFLLRTAVRNRRMTRLEEEAWLAAMSALTERAASELWEQRRALPAVAGKIGDSRNRSLLGTLLQTHLYGQLMSRPSRIVVLGPPNAGKSSLVNALVGRERVLVDSRPGTTRDIVEVRSAIEGVPVILVDTAGLRQSTDSVESEGIRRARAIARRADLVLALVDPLHPVHPEHFRPSVPRMLFVATKSDLYPSYFGYYDVQSSVRTDAGLDALRHRILDLLGALDRASVAGAFLFTQRQAKRAMELSDSPDSEWDARWERWVWGRAR